MLNQFCFSKLDNTDFLLSTFFPDMCYMFCTMCPLTALQVLPREDEPRSCPWGAYVWILENSVESPLSDWKNTYCCYSIYANVFHHFPAYSFRVLIMDYFHTLPFVFIHKSPNFPLLCFKKPSSKRSEGFCGGKHAISSPREMPLLKQRRPSDSLDCQHSGLDVWCRHLGISQMRICFGRYPSCLVTGCPRLRRRLWPQIMTLEILQRGKRKTKTVSLGPSECKMNISASLYSRRVECGLR